jgi:hypothetical protein
MVLEPKRAEGRTKYEPPRLVTISLRPEEAVLGHCKIAGGAGPVSASCQPIGVCPSQGS